MGNPVVLIALLLADLEGFKSSYRSRKLKATLETEPLYQGYWYLLAKKFGMPNMIKRRYDI